MKKFLVLILIVISSSLQAATYYFSTSTGLDSRTSTQARSQSTPWLTITKLNAVLSGLSDGDSVLFKAGETFSGSITANLHANINFGRYGTGANPIISGFSTLNGSFSLFSGNVYYASLDVPRLQMVTVDGVIKGKGRYPNTGFLQYTSHVGQTVTISGSSVNTTASITGNASSIPFDPTGGEAVINKARYYVDAQLITSRSGNTLNLDYHDQGWGFPGGNPVNGMDGNGYFIQDHLGTLDQDGEWWYNKSLKRLYIYSSTNPNSRVIQAAAYDYGVQNQGGSGSTFTNLNIMGFNRAAIDLDYAGPSTISNCRLEKIGGIGIIGLQGVGGDVISNNTIKNCLSGGTSFYERNTQNIISNTVDSIALIIGMMQSGDAAGDGIHFHGDNINVYYNTVTNIGFNGISSYVGSNWIVERNYVNNYCVIKDDGGGIYQYGISAGASISNRRVRRNIVMNGLGAYSAGRLGNYTSYQAFGQAYGIYMDGWSKNVIVDSNFVANNTGGSIHNSLGCHDMTYAYNTCFDGGNLGFLLLDQSGGVSIYNVAFHHNVLVAKGTTERLILIDQQGDALHSNSSYGVFNDNIYALPLVPTAQMAYKSYNNAPTYYSLAQWKSAGQDSRSVISAVSIADASLFRLEWNGTNSTKSIDLPATYKTVDGNVVNGTLVLQPFTGTVLTYFSNFIPGGGAGGSGSGKKMKNPANKFLIAPNGKIWQYPDAGSGL